MQRSLIDRANMASEMPSSSRADAPLTSSASTSPATNTTLLRLQNTTSETAPFSTTPPPAANFNVPPQHQPPTLRSNHISIVSLEDDDSSENDDENEHDDINRNNQDDDGNCSSSIADSSDSDLDNISVNLSTLLAANGILPQQSTMTTDGHSSSTALNGMIVINKGPPAAVVAGNGGSGSNSNHQRPHIGSIALQNSTDITFGDKTFYQGPVTVKQFFLEKDLWRRHESNTTTLGSAGHTIGSVPTTKSTATTTSVPKSVDGCDNDAFVATFSDAEDATDTGMSSGKGTNPNSTMPESKNTETLPKANGVANAPDAKLDVGVCTNCWRKLLRLERRPLVLSGIATTFLIFMALVAFVTYLLLAPTATIATDNELPGDGEDSRPTGPHNSTIGCDLLDTEFGTSLRYIPRILWLAQPPRKQLAALELPSQRVIIAHTATEECHTQAACTLSVRIIQTFHMESNNWDDIGYNFVVGGDGAVYEARGWDKEGAHTRGFNKKSICIAFVGTFINVQPAARQLHAARKLIEEGLLSRKLSPDYKLYGHRQLIASESPGEQLYRIIQTWPHWANVSSAVGQK